MAILLQIEKKFKIIAFIFDLIRILATNIHIVPYFILVLIWLI